MLKTNTKTNVKKHSVTILILLLKYTKQMDKSNKENTHVTWEKTFKEKKQLTDLEQEYLWKRVRMMVEKVGSDDDLFIS